MAQSTHTLYNTPVRSGSTLWLSITISASKSMNSIDYKQSYISLDQGLLPPPPIFAAN